MNKDVIELNGKRYDAVSGVYLGKSKIIPKHITDSYLSGKVIDGVRPVRPVHKAEAPAHHTRPKPAEAPKHTTHHVAHTTASHAKPHQPQRSKTLIHRAVQKPTLKPKPAIKTQAPAEIMLKPHAALAHKPSAYGVDHSRKERAALTNKHHAVRHFSGHTVHSVSTQIVPVHPVPLQAALPVAPALKKHADIFESAIAHATSHTQPKHKAVRHHSRRRKVANSLAAGAAFLIIGGFFAYLNLPQLQVRVASVQAGFGASIPNYAPTGYALQDGVKRSGGTVTLSFHSGDSQYRITQQASTWNSQTLLDDTLALRDEHQTIQKNGQTIYIYKGDGTNAAWVNGGVRYDLIGNAQLSTEDIATIAASL